jgi:hypothetical protein
MFSTTGATRRIAKTSRSEERGRRREKEGMRRVLTFTSIDLKDRRERETRDLRVLFAEM